MRKLYSVLLFCCVSFIGASLMLMRSTVGAVNNSTPDLTPASRYGIPRSQKSQPGVSWERMTRSAALNGHAMFLLSYDPIPNPRTLFRSLLSGSGQMSSEVALKVSCTCPGCVPGMCEELTYPHGKTYWHPGEQVHISAWDGFGGYCLNQSAPCFLKWEGSPIRWSGRYSGTAPNATVTLNGPGPMTEKATFDCVRAESDCPQ